MPLGFGSYLINVTHKFLLAHLEFISDAPYGGQRPICMILDLLTQAFNMDIHGAGIADIFVTPDMIQKLFSGEYLVGRGSQEI